VAAFLTAGAEDFAAVFPAILGDRLAVFADCLFIVTI
jgi:hypothetical protein